MRTLRTHSRSDRPLRYAALRTTRDDIRIGDRPPGIRVHENVMTSRDTHPHELSETSDQKLVNLYLELSAVFGTDAGLSDTHRIQQAAAAAHALEIRGYVEQSGIWTHAERPHLRATA